MKKKPNILFIITDQLRADCIGVEKKHPVLTPTIDSIGGSGARFKSCYTTCPSCIAARRSLFTGQRPSTHGMVGYQDGQPWPYENNLAGELARAVPCWVAVFGALVSGFQFLTSLAVPSWAIVHTLMTPLISCPFGCLYLHFL